jgi:hypothetical protein
MGTVLNWGNPLHKPYPLFLLGFGVITAYIPGIVGASISTGWLFLFIYIPFLFLYCDKIRFRLGFIFICYVILSLVWTENLNIAWFHLLQLIILACVFCVGQNIKDIKPIFKGLALGLGVSATISIFQYFGFYGQIYTITKSFAGFFINPNIFSEVSAVMLISLVVLKLWWWIPVTLPGLILVQSRAAYLALAVGIFISVWKYNRYLAFTLFNIIIIIGLYFYWDKFSLVSFKERLDMWADTIQGFNFFGNGVGSYEVLFPYYATHIDTEIARPRYAHNDLLNIIFEFGIASILFLMVLFNAFKSNKSEVTILLTVCIISLFTYPMHIPTQAFIAFLVAGYLTANITSNRVVWDNWGSNLFTRLKRKKFFKA